MRTALVRFDSYAFIALKALDWKPKLHDMVDNSVLMVAPEHEPQLSSSALEAFRLLNVYLTEKPPCS